MSRELVKVIKYDKVILKIFFTPKKHKNSIYTNKHSMLKK